MNIEIPKLKFVLGQPIIGKGNRKVLVADVVYSIFEKDWLVIYHSLTEDDKIMLMQLRDYLKVLQQEKERTINKEKPEKVVKNRKRKVKSKRKK